MAWWMHFISIRAGDEDGGAALGFQFGQRQRTGTADDEVGSGQQLGHIVDIFLHHEALAGSKAFFLFEILKQLHAVLSGGVDVEHRLVLSLLPCAEVGHHLVDAAGAEASAEGEDDGAVTGTQLGADGVPIPCLLEHFRPHRVAHDLRLFGRTQLFHSGTPCPGGPQW